MKKILILANLFISIATFAQTDCEYSSNVKDSLGNYKSTINYVMHEKVFGNSQSSIFFSLINADGLPSLNMQIIQKSSEFIPAKCLDKSSKIYVQLQNGKIISLIGLDQETCGNFVRNNGENCRIISAYFLFLKDTMEELKKSPISIFRIKFAGESIDYIAKESLVSEVDKKSYRPDHFFMDYLKCIE
jgi:hypothetical protein